MRVPAQIVASPVAGSMRSIPERRERSSSVPSVAHSGAKECPAPATRTVSPRRAASTTASRSSSSDAGRTTTRGAARTFPAQLVHVAVPAVVTEPPRRMVLMRYDPTLPRVMEESLRILRGRKSDVKTATARRQVVSRKSSADS